MRYSPQTHTWEMYFDASAHNIRGNLVALDESGGLVLTFDKPYKLGQETIRPQDAMRFVMVYPGYFMPVFLDLDGSAVGLTTAAEAIDALADGPIFPPQVSISTKGAATVPGATRTLKAQKDDPT